MITALQTLRAAAVVGGSALLLAACGSQASGPAATATPSPSATPTPTPSPSPTAAPVVLAQGVGAMGTILVAASNSHTVYTFNSDSPGVSRCTGGCATTWPPLTVAGGVTPTSGPGVTGQLATITRSDGSLQVTYKGMPLYFFHSDSKAGDTMGNYTGWSLVRP
jgi:predicted lipoprotein with Yx(FWY)xxD motif